MSLVTREATESGCACAGRDRDITWDCAALTTSWDPYVKPPLPWTVQYSLAFAKEETISSCITSTNLSFAFPIDCNESNSRVRYVMPSSLWINWMAAWTSSMLRGAQKKCLRDLIKRARRRARTSAQSWGYTWMASHVSRLNLSRSWGSTRPCRLK